MPVLPMSRRNQVKNKKSYRKPTLEKREKLQQITEGAYVVSGTPPVD
jgi:hypothetical protein